MAVWKRLSDLSESDRHANISLEAVGVWTYIMGTTDACGRRSADPAIIRAKVFTMRAKVTDEWIDARLAELASVGLIHLYAVDGRRYLVLHRMSKYNPPGALKGIQPDYPPPPQDLCDCLQYHPKERLKEALLSGAIAPQVRTVPSLSDLSSGGKEESEKPSGEESVYAMSPAQGLVKASHRFKSPGHSAKSNAFEDLLRQGVDYGHIMSFITSPETQNWDFYELVKRLKPGNGTVKKRLPNTCIHGESTLSYMPECKKCKQEKR